MEIFHLTVQCVSCSFLIKTKKKPCRSVAIIMALNTGCSVQDQLSDISWQRTGTQEGGTWTVRGQPQLSQWAKTSLIGNNFHQNWGIPLGSPLKHHHFRIKLLQRKFFFGGFQDSAIDPCLCSPEFPYLWMEPHCKLSWEEVSLPLHVWWHLCNVKCMSDLTFVLVTGEYPDSLGSGWLWAEGDVWGLSSGFMYESLSLYIGSKVCVCGMKMLRFTGKCS